MLTLRRTLCALVVTVALVGGTARPAGAWQELVGVGWWLRASGTIHCTDGTPEGPNHIVCRNQAPGTGADEGVADETWYPTDYCQVGQITGGDNAGEPARVRLVSPLGSGRSCIPWAYSASVAFYDGGGTWSGYHTWGPTVSVYVFCVWPRPCDTPESQATMIEFR